MAQRSDAAVRRALLDADPGLSRFDPLPRILFHDDFDRGMCGWSELVGNYEHSLDSMLPEYRDLRSPMLSNLSMWDTGTAGSMDGTYALKLGTRPCRGAIAVAVKRRTWRTRGPIRLEAYVVFKPEAGELLLSELDVKAIGVLFDIQDETERWMPHLRYLNAEEGQRRAMWQYKSEREPFAELPADQAAAALERDEDLLAAQGLGQDIDEHPRDAEISADLHARDAHGARRREPRITKLAAQQHLRDLATKQLFDSVLAAAHELS